MSLERIVMRTRRNINGINIDGIITEKTNVEVRVTSNPIESGVDISDHIIIVPSTITLEGVVSDTPLGVQALTNVASNIGAAYDSITGIYGKSEETAITRSQRIYTDLVEMLRKRELIELQTKLKRYENLVFQSIMVNQDKNTSRAVFFTANFREIIIVQSITNQDIIDSRTITDTEKSNAYSDSSNNGDWELSDVGLNVTNKLNTGVQ